MKRLSLFIALHRQRFDRYLVVVAESIPVLNRKIAVDSTTNLIALSANLDCFCHLDHAIFENSNITVKT